MNKELEFPWLSFLGSAFLWCYVAMLVLSTLRILFEPIFIQGAGAPLDFGQLFSFGFWGRVLGTTFVSLVEASLVLIPSFYAGMFACLNLEKRGGQYPEQYSTTFRIAAFVAFAIASGIVILVFYLTDSVTTTEAAGLVGLIIAYYIFDETVAETVWPEIFLKRQEADPSQKFV